MNWVSIAAAILLACYLSVVIWALAAPSEYDPQQGMAIGFIIPVALVLGAAAPLARSRAPPALARMVDLRPRGLPGSHAGGAVRLQAFLPHAHMIPLAALLTAAILCRCRSWSMSLHCVHFHGGSVRETAPSSGSRPI